MKMTVMMMILIYNNNIVWFLLKIYEKLFWPFLIVSMSHNNAIFGNY